MRAPEVLHTGPLEWRLGRNLGLDAYGETSIVGQEIHFGQAALSPRQAMQALIHEYLHAYEENMSVPDSEMRLKHDQIRWVSHAVLDLMSQLGYDIDLDTSGLPVVGLG